MLKKTGSRLAIVFLALTFVFWLTSMVTPGWFVYSEKKYIYYVLSLKLLGPILYQLLNDGNAKYVYNYRNCSIFWGQLSHIFI